MDPYSSQCNDRKRQASPRRPQSPRRSPPQSPSRKKPMKCFPETYQEVTVAILRQRLVESRSLNAQELQEIADHLAGYILPNRVGIIDFQHSIITSFTTIEWRATTHLQALDIIRAIDDIRRQLIENQDMNTLETTFMTALEITVGQNMKLGNIVAFLSLISRAVVCLARRCDETKIMKIAEFTRWAMEFIVRDRENWREVEELWGAMLEDFRSKMPCGGQKQESSRIQTPASMEGSHVCHPLPLTPNKSATPTADLPPVFCTDLVPASSASPQRPVSVTGFISRPVSPMSPRSPAFDTPLRPPKSKRAKPPAFDTAVSLPKSKRAKRPEFGTAFNPPTSTSPRPRACGTAFNYPASTSANPASTSPRPPVFGTAFHSQTSTSSQPPACGTAFQQQTSTSTQPLAYGTGGNNPTSTSPRPPVFGTAFHQQASPSTQPPAYGTAFQQQTSESTQPSAYGAGCNNPISTSPQPPVFGTAFNSCDEDPELLEYY